MISKTSISLFEIFLIITSTFAFSYLVGQTNNSSPLGEKEESFIKKILDYLAKPLLPLSSANPFVPSGCCLETKAGAICQEMSLLDTPNCNGALIGTGCEVVEQCQTGCCYDASSGICTLNAPQGKCESNGGVWNTQDSCNIPECQMGCCVLGDSVSMSTARECTLLSKEYDFQKDFRALDASGSCNAYTGLSKEGACLTDSGDFSGEKNCVLTKKESCSGGEFKPGYLCTSKELNTTCEKKKETSCFEGKDEVYYKDSCGNRANIYDASKYDNDDYWEKIISSSESCSASGIGCGNCDYATGSICTKYESSKDDKPTYGNSVCRNLDCENGKKNGEAWCVSDYNLEGIATAPIGAGNYMAKCIEGDISIEACADFNQELCIQSNGTSYSQARCVINDWRSCIEANNKDSYPQVELACNQLPQCIMFLDIPGNEKYKGLPGFKASGLNTDQARAGDIGKDGNKVLGHCVPRFTSGFQFWSTSDNLFSTGGQTESAANYGGGKAETNTLCSLGNFVCVSHIETDTSIATGSSSKDKENPECNIDAEDNSKQKVSLLMEALNERCRSIGSCGSQTNIQGEFGAVPGFTVTRNYITKKGDQKSAAVDKYVLSDGALEKISSEQQPVKKMGTIHSLSDLTSMSGTGAIVDFLFYTLFTGRVTEEFTQTVSDASGEVTSSQTEYETNQQLIAGAAGTLGALGMYNGGNGVSPGTGAGASAVTTVPAGTGMFGGTYTGGTLTYTPIESSGWVSSPQTLSIQPGQTVSIVGDNGLSQTATNTIVVRDSYGNTLQTIEANRVTSGSQAGSGLVQGNLASLPTNVYPGATISSGSTIYATETITFSNGGTIQAGSTGTIPQGATIVEGSGKTVTTSTTPAASGNSALTNFGISLVAMAAAYLIGKMIVKNSGMTPAEANNFMSALMAGTSVLTQIGLAYSAGGWSGIANLATAGYAGGTAAASAGAGTTAAAGSSAGASGAAAGSAGATTGTTAATTGTAAAPAAAGSAMAVLGAILFWVAVAYFIYTLFQKSTDHEYYIMQFTCEAWEPPKQGDCNVCNEDVRPCTEYKCRSLGDNCHYFAENGEPGFCSSISGIWQASIKPWPEALTEGNKYTSVGETGFKIEANDNAEVHAWEPITFGIITDKQAICKIGFNHSANFDQISTVMISMENEDTGRVDGLHHKITLSPHVTYPSYDEELANAGTTLPIESGENEYYIKCQNFAGQVNEAAFTVKVTMAEGPDLTPPVITRYNPADNSFIKFGENSTNLRIYINEPAECKYSTEYDYSYNEMPFNMSCQTTAAAGYYGEWPCSAALTNLTESANKIFIKCKDQPGLLETDLIKRVVNTQSFEYHINKCQTGLQVNIITPQANSTIEGRSVVPINLEVSTVGCIAGGEASCSYSVSSFGQSYAQFLETGGKFHKQTFTSLSAGSNEIKVSCEDSAGNEANASVNFKLLIDEAAPVITRIYESDGDLVLKTNENAECIYYYNNESMGCDFKFNNATKTFSTTHILSSADQGIYRIKCRDSKLNEPLTCSAIVGFR